MALRMAALSRASDGRWFARKGIPEEVRVEYQRLYGVKREAHLKLPADTPWHEAKTRKAEWEAEVDPLRPSRPRAATARAHLGTWVHELGVDDPNISPNHSWCHLFKRIGDEVGMSERINDAITGHAPPTEGRKYGPPKVASMAEALKKFPRYKLD